MRLSWRRRWAASHWRRSLRRSSSEVPPQTPESWLVVRANSRHGLAGLARRAHGLGGLDLLDGGTGGADREEQVGVGVTAGGDVRASRRVDADRVNERDGEGHGASTDRAHESGGPLPVVKLFTCHRSAVPTVCGWDGGNGTGASR